MADEGDFEDLSQFLEAKVLTLPINGKDYVVPEASAQAWLKLESAVVDGEQKMLDRDIWELALGPAWQELLDDDIPMSHVQVAGVTAYYWQTRRPNAALAVWSAGKGQRPKKPSGTGTRPQTRSGAGATTRRRASGTGTTTRRKS